MLTRENRYNIYEIQVGQDYRDLFPPESSTPSFTNTFSGGLSAGAITSGELGSQITMQDGYLQSSNYDGTLGTGGTVGWFMGPTNVDFPTVEAQELHIPDEVTAESFHVATDGDTWWGATTADFDADNDNATAYVLKTGVAKFQSVILSGSVAISGIANNTSTDISLLEKTHTMVFSVTDANTIAWTSGTVTLSNGRTFSISSGNTGNMAALTYIYIDPAVSSTVLQVTTTAATAMGANKILLGTAQNHTVSAHFIPYGPGQPLIDGANIGALSIVAANIAASTITATKMSVSQLSAIAADMGTITAGTVTGATLQTASSGTRFVMTSTALQGIDSGGDVVFEVVISGGNAGDVIMGDDASGSYAIWDNSAGTFEVFANNITGDTISLTSYELIDGTVLPVAVTISEDGQVVSADESSVDRDSFVGFITGDYTDTSFLPSYLSGTAVSTDTDFSLTANAGTNRYLVVFFDTGDGDALPSAVSWNSNALTELYNGSASSGFDESIWGVAIGTSGTNQTADVVVTGDDTGFRAALVYSNVDQSDPIGEALTSAGTATSLNIAISHPKGYGLFVSAYHASNLTVDTVGFTERFNLGGDDWIAGDSPGYSESSITCSQGSSLNIAVAGVSLNPSQAGQDVVVYITGRIGGFSGLSPGQPYYLANTAGDISLTPGGSTVVKVARAVSTTSILILQT